MRRAVLPTIRRNGYGKIINVGSTTANSGCRIGCTT